MEIRTLNDVFFTVVGRNHDRAMLDAAGWRVDARFRQHNFGVGCMAIARQLQAWGINQGDRVVTPEREPAGMGDH